MNHTIGAQRTNAKYAKILAEVDKIATQKAYDSMSQQLFDDDSMIVVVSRTSSPLDRNYKEGEIYRIVSCNSLLCKYDPKHTWYRCVDAENRKVQIAHRDCRLHISSPNYYPHLLPKKQ